MSNSMNDEPYTTNSDEVSGKLQGGFYTQYKSLIIRNLLIKRREKRKTLVEIALPLFILAFLAIQKLSSKDTIYKPITKENVRVPLDFSSIDLLTGSIFVYPNTSDSRSIMQELGNVTNMPSNSIQYFESEDELLNAYREDEKSVSVGLIFLNILTADNFSYIIRTNPMKYSIVSPSTLETPGNECRDIPKGYKLESGATCKPNSYFHSGFLSLQSALDFVIINLKSRGKRSIPTINLQIFPQNELTSKNTFFRNIFPFYMVLAWSQFIIYMMILIVEEKEKKIKEEMKIMGLRGSAYWYSWLTIYLFYVVILTIICAFILPLAKILNANIVLLLLFFFLYGTSSISLAIMLTSFFDKSKVAGSVILLLTLPMSCLYFLQVYLSDRIAPAAFWCLALLSPCAFSFGLDKAILLDISTKDGLDWDNVWEGPGLPFAGSLIMISVDIVLYILLAFYFDNVIPSEYATKEKPWYIFQKSTYLKKKKVPLLTDIFEQSNESFVNADLVSECYEDNEPFPEKWKGREAVRIRNLYKIFKSRGKEDIYAVNGLSLDIYEGHITAILGHNGAGKTTLFNMLTGLTSVTSGSATIYNYNVSDQRDLAEIWKLTGVCPQHDTLFVTLTPREHLTFYASIKGVPANLVQDKVNEMLQETNLLSKADTKADDLSGGQKRKLSVGIAFVGDPKIVFLDEPTAGVDAYSRRHLWALLKKKKHDKILEDSIVHKFQR